MMEEHIGFPEYILNPKLLDKDYEHVSLREHVSDDNILHELPLIIYLF